MLRRRRRLPIDLTLTRCHGEPFRDGAGVYRSKGRAGTSHFHAYAYASAYVVRRAERFTVTPPPVPRGASLAEVVKVPLEQARSAGVRASLVLLDRGFEAVDVVRRLHRARLPFVMPVRLTGRKAGHLQGPSGVRMFTVVKRSGWFGHTVVSGARTALAAICAARRIYRGKWKRQGRQRLIYACWGVAGHSCTWVRETCRSRFGIESSCRRMSQARGRTSTRRPELRLPYVGMAPVLCNERVWLHWEVLSTPRRGGRVVRQERLRLRTLLRRLQQAAEREHGVITETTMEREACSLVRAG